MNSHFAAGDKIYDRETRRHGVVVSAEPSPIPGDQFVTIDVGELRGEEDPVERMASDLTWPSLAR